MMKKINADFLNEYSECCDYPALYYMKDNTKDRWDLCPMCLKDASFYEAEHSRSKADPKTT